MTRINQSVIAKKPGDKLPNGAIMLENRWYEVEAQEMRGYVLGLNPNGSRYPFITWDRWVSCDGQRQTETTVWGHYFWKLEDALKDLEERWEAKTHERERREAIRERGIQDGRAAASWIEDDIPRILQGMMNGDPEVLDALPRPRLGGEFADDPTWEDIVKAETDIEELSDDGEIELLQVYEEAFDHGIEQELKEKTPDV